MEANIALNLAFDGDTLVLVFAVVLFTFALVAAWLTGFAMHSICYERRSRKPGPKCKRGHRLSPCVACRNIDAAPAKL